MSTSFTIFDAENTPVKDAVIQLISKNPTPPSTTRKNELSQKDKQFTPFVLPIQRGTSIVFPNYDDIQHHVYSFSGIKKFELKLSKDSKANPITFEKPGIVPVGCNIHDWMLAYIYVVDTPYFSTTNSNGSATLSLPSDGEYLIKIWHPRLPDENVNYTKEGITKIVAKDGTTKVIALNLTISTGSDADEDIDEFEDY
ncbi:hypothetical protein A9Q99_02150 [Gammaproteobacteria bacterium 45_16_T64]|nr:hypothetical protein A9Q99_02150 [Gammaproteobacteria bacterium 45_16_T64]